MWFEFVVLIFALSSGLLPLFLGRWRQARIVWIGSLTLAMMTVVVGLWSSRQYSAQITESKVAYRPIEVAQSGDEYVSSDRCRACHPRQYDTWFTSYHRTMTQKATPDAILGDIDNVTVQAFGRDFRLSRRSDVFWVNMYDPDLPVTQRSKRIDRPMMLTTGSHHLQVYWYATGKDRRLGQLPVMWLREARRWVPRTASFICPAEQPLSSDEGRWNQTCIKCHVTQGRPRIDAAQRSTVDTHVVEFGISCEACHGPGETHVVAHGDPLRRYRQYFSKAQDETIVNPKKLTHRQSAQVCGQCHGVWIAGSEAQSAALYWSGFTYRPGDELTETRHIFQTDQQPNAHVESFLESEPHFLRDTFWPDGMVRVSGREYNGLVRSPCFQHGTMSCLSCHQLHQDSADTRLRMDWANDQLAVGMQSNHACGQCHQEFRDEAVLSAHSHHELSSAGSRCYNCHMPHTTYGLLKAIRAHQITSPRVQESVQIGRPNACNQCHVDKTLPWTAKWLQTWYDIDPPTEFTPEENRYSATLLWCLTGDAGQRALAAWTLGWQPALRASRTDWILPVLGQLLDDPYYAVRFVAHRSLRAQTNYERFDFDYLGSPSYRDAASVRAYMPWRDEQSRRRVTGDPSLLIAADGDLVHDEFQRLLQQRDNRQVVLNE